MKVLSFVAKLALLCNLCYLFTVLGRVIPKLETMWHDVVSTIAVLGVVSVFVNLFVCIAWLVCLVFKKKCIPLWLGITNLVFLVVQGVNIFILEL
jgi:hypothetical protein